MFYISFHKNNRICAFTLVEIMITVAIIALLTVIALPSLLKSRDTSILNMCKNNLRLIGHSLELWRIGNDMSDTDVPANISALSSFIKGNAIPICGRGGTYSFAVGNANEITCSYHGTYNVATGIFTES